jgi:hypothetical protein
VRAISYEPLRKPVWSALPTIGNSDEPAGRLSTYCQKPSPTMLLAMVWCDEISVKARQRINPWIKGLGTDKTLYSWRHCFKTRMRGALMPR